MYGDPTQIQVRIVLLVHYMIERYEASWLSMAPNQPLEKKIKVDAFHGLAGLQALEPVWRALETGTSGLRFIHYYGWYRSHLECVDYEDGAVVFFLMSVAGSPLAIFPLQRANVRRYGIALRVWQILWPNDMGVCDFVLAKTEGASHLMTPLLEFLRKDRNYAWDLLKLQDTLVDSCAQYLLRGSSPRRSVTFKHHYSKFIPCDADYETTMARLSGDFRRNLRRQTKKLMELGNIEFRFVTNAGEMEEAFTHFLHAEAASWKGDAGTKSALQLHQNQVRFYRRLMSEFSGYGACSINLVLLDGECIASQFCLTIEDTLYLLKIGYHEKYRAIGPGNVLLHELIQRCCADKNIDKVSFVTGATWNDRWSPESLDVFESHVYNNTLPGLAVCVAERMKNRGRQFKHWYQSIPWKSAKSPSG